MAITVHFEGRDWEFEDDRLTIAQAMVMHAEHGLTLRAWQDGIKELDPRAIACSYWLMLQQNGVVKPLREVDFEPVTFMTAYIEALEAGKQATAAEPDPTPGVSLPAATPKRPGSSTSRSAKSAAATSSSSPASATSAPET